MTLSTAELGGRIPLPIRGTFGPAMGNLDDNQKLYFPGSIGNKPPGPSMIVPIIAKLILTAPVVASATAYISTALTGATNMPNNSTITVPVGALWDGAFGNATKGKPDFDRNVVVTVTHATSIVAVNGVISGLDFWGNPISETWSVTATGTSKTYTTATSFYQVQQITITSASNAQADSLQLGTGPAFGLIFPLGTPAALQELTDAAVPTAGTFVAASTNTNVDKTGTYTPNITPNGAHVYTVWYISDDPTLIGTGGP